MAVLDTPDDTHINPAATASPDLNGLRHRPAAGASDEPTPSSAGDAVPTDESGSEKKVANRDGQAARSDVKFTYRPSRPAHVGVKESPLSSGAIFKQSHAGLFNLCIVVLVAVNSRLIIENLMKYGWLIRTGFWFSSKSLRDWPLFMCCLSLPLFAFAAYLVEKFAYRKYLSEPIVVSLHILISVAAVVYPVSVILSCDSAFLSGVTLMLFACIIWLKLVSYAHTNYDMRAVAKSVEKGEAPSAALNVDYSYDVNFNSLVYFMIAPTLCYQYINPIIQNSEHPFKGNLLYGIERVLKLSVPNLYVWLCMFYCFFHLWLNILAELLRFGDREFYKDWWNAKTVEEYWRMWNMPVHKWMVRHIYFPCLRHKVPKGVAIFIAFFVSAAFHELCIAVPCHIFKFWAFLGIMFQVRLSHVTTKFTSVLIYPTCLAYKCSSGEVQELDGGEHDILVNVLHIRSTDVCASLLSRPDEQERERWNLKGKHYFEQRLIFGNLHGVPLHQLLFHMRELYRLCSGEDEVIREVKSSCIRALLSNTTYLPWPWGCTLSDSGSVEAISKPGREQAHIANKVPAVTRRMKCWRDVD
ncbi:unnamed protein product [Linum tenue]|uniref:O-acyltransferase n=1 Tax=Linum tenue TaxID=586396 RepID=A0AAV0HTF8_9ROSI|nr:unnamed protein product [Linum tenue]